MAFYNKEYKEKYSGVMKKFYSELSLIHPGYVLKYYGQKESITKEEGKEYVSSTLVASYFGDPSVSGVLDIYLEKHFNSDKLQNPISIIPNGNYASLKRASPQVSGLVDKDKGFGFNSMYYDIDRKLLKGIRDIDDTVSNLEFAKLWIEKFCQQGSTYVKMARKIAYIVITGGGFHLYFVLNNEAQKKYRDYTTDQYKLLRIRTFGMFGIKQDEVEKEEINDFGVDTTKTMFTYSGGLRMPGILWQKNWSTQEPTICEPYRIVNIKYDNGTPELPKEVSFSLELSEPRDVNDSNIYKMNLLDLESDQRDMITVQETMERTSWNKKFRNGFETTNRDWYPKDTKLLEKYPSLNWKNVMAKLPKVHCPKRGYEIERFQLLSNGSINVYNDKSFVYETSSGYKIKYFAPGDQRESYINCFSDHKERPRGPILAFIFTFFQSYGDKNKAHYNAISFLRDEFGIGEEDINKFTPAKDTVRIYGDTATDKYITSGASGTEIVFVTKKNKTTKSKIRDKEVEFLVRLKMKNKEREGDGSNHIEQYQVCFPVISREGVVEKKQQMIGYKATMKDWNKEYGGVSGLSFKGGEEELSSIRSILETAVNIGQIPVRQADYYSGHRKDNDGNDYTALGKTAVIGNLPEDFVPGDADFSGVDLDLKDVSIKEMSVLMQDSWTPWFARLTTAFTITGLGMNMYDDLLKCGFHYEYRPGMFFSGLPGKGKNAVMGCISSMMGYNMSVAKPERRMHAVSSITPHTLKCLVEDYSPIFLDEFSIPNNSLLNAKYMQIETVVKDILNGNKIMRGTNRSSRHKIEYEVNSFIIISGQSVPNDDALRERCYFISVTEGLRNPKSTEDILYNIMKHTCVKDISKYYHSKIKDIKKYADTIRNVKKVLSSSKKLKQDVLNFNRFLDTFQFMSAVYIENEIGTQEQLIDDLHTYAKMFRAVAEQGKESDTYEIRLRYKSSIMSYLSKLCMSSSEVGYIEYSKGVIINYVRHEFTRPTNLIKSAANELGEFYQVVSKGGVFGSKNEYQCSVIVYDNSNLISFFEWAKVQHGFSKDLCDQFIENNQLNEDMMIQICGMFKRGNYTNDSKLDKGVVFGIQKSFTSYFA